MDHTLITKARQRASHKLASDYDKRLLQQFAEAGEEDAETIRALREPDSLQETHLSYPGQDEAIQFAELMYEKLKAKGYF